MAYAIYRGGRTIRRIKGNPRSPSNQKGMITWSPTIAGLKSWIRKYGNKRQKDLFL